MNILIIGNGGREHAFAWKIRQSKQCDELFVAPGNAGTSAMAKNVPIAVDDFEGLGAFCVEQKIDLVVVGPEVPLVKGIRNHIESEQRLKHLLIVGPGKDGAQLEGSKDFSKQFMVRNGIPTAMAKTFSANQLPEAEAYIDTCNTPIVLKADGLAAGKGVIISPSRDEAKVTIREMLANKKFGTASEQVLIEEFLEGIELSVFILTDGKHYITLPEAKDYKRIGENDSGPNTGGMGAVSPVIFANADFMKKVDDKIVRPTINGLQKEGIDFKGFIFVGLMNVKGEPYVIEYNVRMGDPETQVVLPRIKTDFVDLLVATAKGNLSNQTLEVSQDYATTVVMVSGGYPENYEKGKNISLGADLDKTLVFHAGTKSANGIIITDGGRVLAVTGMGMNLSQASRNAYQRVSHIKWAECYFRSDIGKDLENLN